MAYFPKKAHKALARPPGSWSPWGKAEELLQKDAPAEGKGTLISRVEEGFLFAFNARLQSGNDASEHCEWSQSCEGQPLTMWCSLAGEYPAQWIIPTEINIVMVGIEVLSASQRS